MSAQSSVVKINAISVPPQAGPELEKRFAARAHTVDGADGFLGFQLLRPVAGDDRYFVVTHWRDEEAFAAWRDGDARARAFGTTGCIYVYISIFYIIFILILHIYQILYIIYNIYNYI